MKITHIVYVVLFFGISVSLVAPYLFSFGSKKMQTYEAQKQNELAKAEVEKNTETTSEENKQVSDADLALATSEELDTVLNNATLEEPIMPVPVVAEATYDGLTMEELTAKINRTLKSNLAGTGNLFVKYAMANNVDPYLAVAITLLETGCNYRCSAQVSQCNNVGGMKGAGSCQGTSYASFPTLEQGIEAFIVNIKKNYYDFGLNTPELMNRKYAASNTWAMKVNNYIASIKAA